MRPRFRPVPSDRVSQTSELTFDVSVFEMFVAWGAGASVYVIPANQLMAPARFITAGFAVSCALKSVSPSL